VAWSYELRGEVLTLVLWLSHRDRGGDPLKAGVIVFTMKRLLKDS
jgi:hypothetical protein